jgi:hypothetical protein
VSITDPGREQIGASTARVAATPITPEGRRWGAQGEALVAASADQGHTRRGVRARTEVDKCTSLKSLRRVYFRSKLQCHPDSNDAQPGQQICNDRGSEAG